ncbi:MAG: response regulator [Acidobacteriota bacterium]
MGAKLLLADDSITIQKVVELTFAETEHRVVAVGNGRDLLRRFEEIKPDLVLCDVVMPDINGYEICQKLKSDPATLHIPVVLLTGTFEPFDRDRALAAGCDAIVTKPFEARELITTVEDLLERSRAFAPPDTSGVLDTMGDLGIADGVQSIDFTTTGFDQMVAPPPLPEVVPVEGIELTGSFASLATPPPAAAPPELAARITLDAPAELFAPGPSEELAPPWAEPPEGAEAAPARAEEPPWLGVPADEGLDVIARHPAPALAEEMAPEDLAAESAAAMALLEEVERRAAEAAQPPVSRPGVDFEFAPPTAVPVAEVDLAPFEEVTAVEEAAPPAPEPPAAFVQAAVELPAALAGGQAPYQLTQDDVDRIARRVLELAEPLLDRIAWEVIPDMAEMIVRQRIRELEEAAEEEA